MTELRRYAWVQPALAGVLLLVVLAPAFAWASGAVGYAEPMENVAERTGAIDEATALVASPFPDYSVPGLGGSAGTFVSGLVGTALTLLVALAAGRVLRR